MKVFKGRLVHSLGRDTPIQVLDDHLIGYEDSEGNGKILFVEPSCKIHKMSTEYGFCLDSVIQLTDSQFLIPGLVDTHIHASQYVNAGLGYDLMLLDWLETYTYPTEAKFKEIDFARDVYTKAVRRSLLHGTTTASYFATIHLEGTKELCRVIEKLGQRALVGKVCMDMESPDFYVEETQASIEDTRRFIEFTLQMKNPLIKPTITPRFAPTCSLPLLKGLGELAREYDVHIQSHLCEQIPEIEYTKKLFPEYKNTADIFDDCNLLTKKTVMAHCIYLDKDEVDLIQKRQVGVAHCPHSNFNICSGTLDVRKLLDRDIKVGLGTDISGGHSSSILSVLRSSIDASKAHSFRSEVSADYKVISHHHGFYMATLGGAKALSMDDEIGNFVVGKQFDALLIDVSAPCPEAPVFDIFKQNTFQDILMKYLYLGDDRNILRRFIAGKEIFLG